MALLAKKNSNRFRLGFFILNQRKIIAVSYTKSRCPQN